MELRSCRMKNFFRPAWRDVVIGFVPTDSAFERRRRRAGLKSQFALRAFAIHEHHVLRDFYAFDGNLRLTSNQARKCGFSVGAGSPVICARISSTAFSVRFSEPSK